jgi:nucleotide-binding universal stress UspA family protein
VFKRILVPVDGSVTADCGLAEAIELARGLKSAPHLVLLNVVEWPTAVSEAGVFYDATALASSLREQGQGVLTKAQHTCEQAGVSVETEQRDALGRVADVIAERAADRACDLIVMGTHGRRGANRWVMGSDAEIVARSSAVPVMLVRERHAGG